jgi:hypothetical protein
MAGDQRDEFPAWVKALLAKRAGYLCSNPACRAKLIGPSSSDPKRTVLMAVAAHISAAAPGGPRYDFALTPGERASPDNGICLCPTCSVLIDKNQGADFASATLQDWKRQAEHRATSELGRPATGSSVAPIPSPIDTMVLREACAQLIAQNREFEMELPVRTLVDAGSVEGLPEAELLESMQLLSESGYLVITNFVGAPLSNQLLSLTVFGFDFGIREIRPDYDAFITQVAQRVVAADGREDSLAIATELGSPHMLVKHALAVLVEKNRISTRRMGVKSMTDGMVVMVQEISAALKRELREVVPPAQKS